MPELPPSIPPNSVDRIVDANTPLCMVCDEGILHPAFPVADPSGRRRRCGRICRRRQHAAFDFRQARGPDLHRCSARRHRRSGNHRRAGAERISGRGAIDEPSRLRGNGSRSQDRRAEKAAHAAVAKKAVRCRCDSENPAGTQDRPAARPGRPHPSRRGAEQSLAGNLVRTEDRSSPQEARRRGRSAARASSEIRNSAARLPSCRGRKRPISRNWPSLASSP